jgi:hypothetical protein
VVLPAGKASAEFILSDTELGTVTAEAVEANLAGGEPQAPANEDEDEVVAQVVVLGPFGSSTTGGSSASQGASASSALSSCAFELPAPASVRRHVIEKTLYFPAPPPRGLLRPPAAL